MTPLPSTSPVPRRRARLPALAAASLLLAALLVGLPRAIIGEARAADVEPTHDAQLTHILEVITASNAGSSKVPKVYLLGGSSARDSTGTNKSWAAQVRRLGGMRVRTYNISWSNQTYAQDITIVNHLPAGPSIVLIGVGIGRYTWAVTQAGAGAESADSHATRSPRRRHHVAHLLSDAQKRLLVQAWLTNRYPLFEKNYAGNAAKLDELIATCQARDLHPVLLELPLNLQIVGHAFDTSRTRYRDSCRKLAKKYGIPNISFLHKVHLVSRDFADLFHLVQPGRVKWQLMLSKTVVVLLKRYDMGGEHPSSQE